MTHLLVTNDFPPKVGGIQSYLWELWRRLDPDSFAVFTSPHVRAAEFDAGCEFRVQRYDRFWLPPTPRVKRRVESLIARYGATAAVIDPAWPLGWVGPRLSVPYGVVLHGAEVTVPSRLPGAATMLAHAVAGAALVISASRWAEDQARRLVTRRDGDFPTTVYVPPGVDTDRFVPLNLTDRRAARRRLGLDPDAALVVGLSRLVPRKGFDRLIDAAAEIANRHPNLQVVIAGKGRDERRLRGRIRSTGAPAKLIGFVDDSDVADLYGCADAFAMLCRDRWLGLEQEGFGIVFVEAAAAGCPQVAGRSGGSGEAVEHGRTGLVVDPTSVTEVAGAIDSVIADPGRSQAMRAESRRRAVAEFDYGVLAGRLAGAIQRLVGAGRDAA